MLKSFGKKKVMRNLFCIDHITECSKLKFWFWFINQQDSLTNMFADALA